MSQFASPEQYIEGASVQLRATLLDFDGVAVAPANVRCLVIRPGTTTSFFVATTPSGQESVVSIMADTPGMWNYRFESIVAPYAVYEGRFLVTRRRVPAVP